MDIPDGNTSNTPLTWASYFAQVPIVEVLLANGADANVTNPV